MSIESEIADIQTDIDSTSNALSIQRRSLELLQSALKTGFLDTLKFVIEEGLLPDLMKRLGFGQESEVKAGELVDVATNPLVFEEMLKEDKGGIR